LRSRLSFIPYFSEQSAVSGEQWGVSSKQKTGTILAQNFLAVCATWLQNSKIIIAASRQERQVRSHFFLCGPFDGVYPERSRRARDMLCVFARYIPALVAALP